MSTKTFDAFISHSSRDAETATAIKKHLQSAGIRCWKAPDDILAGESWPEAILRAIGDSTTMILVWSAHSKASSEVSKELTLAMRNKVSVVPFRIENVPASSEWEYHLVNTHWMDAYAGDIESHCQLLASHIRKLVSGSTSDQENESEKAGHQARDNTIDAIEGESATGASGKAAVAFERKDTKESFSKQQRPKSKSRRIRRAFTTILLIGLVIWLVSFVDHFDRERVIKMAAIEKSNLENSQAKPKLNPGALVQEIQKEKPPVAAAANKREAHLLGNSFTNSLGQKFVPIAGAQSYFCVSTTRVMDYVQFVAKTRREWKPAGFPQKPDHPAVRVNYHDAMAFCDWLTNSERATGVLPRPLIYRLPKDLEWSLAAGITSQEMSGPPAWRAGGIPRCYPWGSSWPPPKNFGNYDTRLKVDPFPFTSPVGYFAPNKFGLFDMSGNVYQWVLEDYDETMQGCLRGGSWPDESEDSINLSNRFPASKDANFKCYGFRCVIAPSENRL